jgi:hypothetical protein
MNNVLLVTFLDFCSQQIDYMGWPLLTVETEENGDSKSTNERDRSLVGSLGSLCRYKRFYPALAALIATVKHICSLIVHYFNSFDPIAQQAGQAVVPGPLFLNMCLWFTIYATFFSSIKCFDRQSKGLNGSSRNCDETWQIHSLEKCSERRQIFYGDICLLFHMCFYFTIANYHEGPIDEKSVRNARFASILVLTRCSDNKVDIENRDNILNDYFLKLSILIFFD